ncbi:MAG: type 4a pilus biogenesis protein PilO [Caldithrix sp.]|nr:type 4a pilus biogenesis protein PilO [Caldithrix sp.]
MKIKRVFAALIGMLILVIVGWYLILHRPMQKEINKTQVKIDNLLEKLQKARKAQINLKVAKTRYEQGQQDLRRARERFISKEELSIVTKDLDKHAKKYRLDMANFSPRLSSYFKESSNEKVSTLPVEMEVMGDYLNIGRFIESWEELPFYITHEEISIEYMEKEKTLKAVILANLYTINKDE